MKTPSRYFQAPKLVLATGLALVMGLLKACSSVGDATSAAPAAPAAVAPAVLLIGNTRGNHVVSIDRTTSAYINDFIAPRRGRLGLQHYQQSAGSNH